MTEFSARSKSFIHDKPIADIFSDHQKTLKALDQRLEVLDRSLRAYHQSLSVVALNLNKSRRLHDGIAKRLAAIDNGFK